MLVIIAENTEDRVKKKAFSLKYIHITNITDSGDCFVLVC